MAPVNNLIMKAFYNARFPQLNYRNIVYGFKSKLPSLFSSETTKKVAKELGSSLENSNLFKISLVKETPAKNIYRLVENFIKDSNIKSDIYKPEILDAIKHHITRFNVSARKGIQGSHGREFFDRIFKLSKNSTTTDGADITSFINKFVSGDRFSKVLSYKNADGSLKMVFSRPKNADIILENFRMNTIADFPQYSMCNYTCKGKEYQKTVCSVKTLKTVLASLRDKFESSYPIKCVSKMSENGMSERGIFRIATQDKPYCFFVCDSSLYPVEQNFIKSRVGLGTQDLLDIPALSLFYKTT